jgi:hypothetical protein
MSGVHSDRSSSLGWQTWVPQISTPYDSLLPKMPQGLIRYRQTYNFRACLTCTIAFTRKTVRFHIPGWDSYHYITFAVAVEA